MACTLKDVAHTLRKAMAYASKKATATPSEGHGVHFEKPGTHSGGGLLLKNLARTLKKAILYTSKKATATPREGHGLLYAKPGPHIEEGHYVHFKEGRGNAKRRPWPPL